MLKEAKIKMAFDMYDDQMKAIEKEYERRFKGLEVNSFGEVIADDLIKLNQWAIEAKAEMKETFVKIISEIG